MVEFFKPRTKKNNPEDQNPGDRKRSQTPILSQSEDSALACMTTEEVGELQDSNDRLIEKIKLKSTILALGLTYIQNHPPCSKVIELLEGLDPNTGLSDDELKRVQTFMGEFKKNNPSIQQPFEVIKNLLYSTSSVDSVEEWTSSLGSSSLSK